MTRALIAAVLVIATLVGARAQETLATLQGANWRLVQIGDAALPAARPITLRIDLPVLEGAPFRVSGRAACNTYRGFARIPFGDTRITLDAQATTRMACPGAAGLMERRYLEALATAFRYDVTTRPGTLFLRDDQGRPIMELRREP